MPILNLKRDAGFLYHGVEDLTQKQSLARDLRHIFKDTHNPEEFLNQVQFMDHVSQHAIGCVAPDWSPSAIFKKRVNAFFNEVKDVVTLGDDVFYDIADQAQRATFYDGADLFIDYKTSWRGFSARFESASHGMILNPESGELDWIQTGFWRAVDFPHEVVRDLQNAGVDKKQVARELDYLDFLEPEQRIVAIRYRYVPMTEGLHEADRQSVIRLALNKNFMERRQCDFAIYTQAEHLQDLCKDWMDQKAGSREGVVALSEKLRGKFTLHRDYAARVTEDLAHVSQNLVLSVLVTESNGDRAKVSPMGYKGLMQLGNQEFAKYVDANLPQAIRDDIFNYRSNMSAGSRYLQWCFENFNPEKSVALAAANYNWGCGNTKKYRQGTVPLRQETHDYIAKVLVFSRLFSELGVG